MENEQPIEQPVELTRKQRRMLRREERFLEKDQKVKRHAFKRKIKIGLLILGGVVIVGSIVWYFVSLPPLSEEDIVSKNGLHIHPKITIFAQGEKKVIPGGIGLGMGRSSIHTHDKDGIIHVELNGVVRKNNVRLDRFFKVWGKKFMSFGESVTMTVNGKESTELENYQMKDGDKIELRYE